MLDTAQSGRSNVTGSAENDFPLPSLSGTTMPEKMFDELSLRLLKAFFAIEDHAAREVVVALAEAAAAGATIEAQTVAADAKTLTSS